MRSQLQKEPYRWPLCEAPWQSYLDEEQSRQFGREHLEALNMAHSDAPNCESLHSLGLSMTKTHFNDIISHCHGQVLDSSNSCLLDSMRGCCLGSPLTHLPWTLARWADLSSPRPLTNTTQKPGPVFLQSLSSSQYAICYSRSEPQPLSLLSLLTPGFSRLHPCCFSIWNILEYSCLSPLLITLLSFGL